MQGPWRLLLVEDDPQLARLLRGLLEAEGYVVEVAADGHRGLHLALTRPFDVMVLDRGLPAIEGLDLLGRLRAAGRHVPTLVLSALANPRDRVDGLDAGAEDYLGKPFDIEELLARLVALLRRRGSRQPAVRVPGGTLRVAARSVQVDDGGSVELTERETRLLAVLADSPSRVFSREELVDSVFENADDVGVVETYVHYLRRKLGRRVIVTVRGYGYRVGGST